MYSLNEGCVPYMSTTVVMPNSIVLEKKKNEYVICNNIYY